MVTAVKSARTGPHSDPSCRKEQLINYLRASAHRYFPDFDTQPVQVLVRGTLNRKMSTVYEFTLRAGSRQHSVLAKVNKVRRNDDRRLANLQKRDSFDRPRIMPWITHETSARMEHDALAAIKQHFDRLADPRLGAVRVLDLLPEMGGIIVERLSYHNLNDLLRRQHRLRGGWRVTALRDAVRNAGAWLREFHRLEPPDHAVTRHATRDDFLRLTREFVDFLVETCGRKSFFRALGKGVERAARRLLSKRLPLALSHGDFGPRNVLVGPRSRAVGFDTRARCQAPIYEDLAYFLFMLDYDTPAFFAPGLIYSPRLVAQLKGDFLRGYYDEAPVPRGAIALFELQSMLDKWAPMVLGCHEAKGLVRIAKQGRLATMSPLFVQHARRLLNSAECS